ncbi:MAG TPA: hypothetical protein VIL34_14760 [Actinopolymorphaceae bacterium]
MSGPLRIAALPASCGIAGHRDQRPGAAILFAAPTMMLGGVVGCLRLRRLILARAPVQSNPDWAAWLARAKNPEES